MKKILTAILVLTMVVSLCACGSGSKSSPGTLTSTTPAPASPGTLSSSSAASSAASGSSAASATAEGSGVEDGTLTIAMECAYTPYNWTQTDSANNAVPISNSTAGEYANGYDIMIAQKICDANGWKLEVQRQEWGSLIPAVQSGLIDAAIAGQSMTAERMEQVDFAGPYYYADIVCLTTKDSKYAAAKGISDLAGGKCTSQLGTIWYDTCLPQIKNADVQPAKDDATSMLVALESGTVDFVCTDSPTAKSALVTYPDMVILSFKNSGDDFKVDEGDINIGISLRKGNTVLQSAMNKVLSAMTADDFSKIMDDAIKIAPINS